MNFISEWWNYILAGISVLCALVGAYLGGRKVGNVETQAKADVTAARVESAQVSAVADKQNQNVKVAKDVQANNSALSDNAARDKLRQSSFNRPE